MEENEDGKVDHERNGLYVLNSGRRELWKADSSIGLLSRGRGDRR